MRTKIEILKNLTDKLVNTYQYKNERYGDSFSKLREEYPIAICVRLSDKLSSNVISIYISVGFFSSTQYQIVTLSYKFLNLIWLLSKQALEQ